MPNIFSDYQRNTATLEPPKQGTNIFVDYYKEEKPKPSSALSDIADRWLAPDTIQTPPPIITSTPRQPFGYRPSTLIAPPPEEQQFVQEYKQDKAANLTKRFGKQIANSFARIGESIISSPLSPIGVSQEKSRPYRQQAMKELDASGFKGSAAQAEQMIRTRADQLAASDLVPKFQVKPAETVSEKATDVAAGLTSFMTQLALTRKILPKGTSEPLVWEVQNQLGGGIPGQGFVTRAALGGIAKIPTSTIAGKAAKVGLESSLFAGITSLTGGKAEDMIVSALVPIAFNGWNFAKQRSYLTEYEGNLRQQAQANFNKRAREGMPEPFNRMHYLVDIRAIDNAVAKAKQKIYHDDAFAPAKEKWETERQLALKMVKSGKPDQVARGNAILDFMGRTTPTSRQEIKIPTTRTGEVIEAVKEKIKGAPKETKPVSAAELGLKPETPAKIPEAASQIIPAPPSQPGQVQPQEQTPAKPAEAAKAPAKEPWEMTREEYEANPPEGYKVEKLAKEDIARANSDGTISLDPDNFFGHSVSDRKNILAHEKAHFIEERIKPEHKARLMDNPIIKKYRGRNINEKLANMIEDGTLPREVIEEYKSEPWAKEALGKQKPGKVAPVKQQLIDEIVSKAREPVPEIVERFELKGTNGKWYFPQGFPAGVQSTGERRSAGFAYRNKEGITYGTREKTKQELIDRHNQYQEKNMADLRSELEKKSLDELKQSVQYWRERVAQTERLKAPVPKEEKSKPIGTWEQQKKSELRELKKRRFKTANDEIKIKRIQKQLVEKPLKWQVGQGVGLRRYGGQVNRGLRITAVHPERHQAEVQYVKDVGQLTDYEHGRTELVDMIDLIRDKKFDAKPTFTVEQPKEVSQPITKAEKDVLREQGYSVAEILKMTPEEARGKLKGQGKEEQVPREKYAIYQIKTQKGNRFAVRENLKNEKGFGDALFETREAADNYAETIKKRDVANENFYAEQRAKEEQAKQKKLEQEKADKEKRAMSPIIIDNTLIESKDKLAKGRIKSFLSKKMRHEDLGIVTWRQAIESGQYIKTEAAVVPAVRYNRTKFNRMSGEEQKEYEKRLAEKKNEYRLYAADGGFVTIPKMIYDVIVEQPQPVPKAKAPESGEGKKETKNEPAKEETVVEPEPSAEIKPGKARATLEPTGKLNPTKPEDAAKIVELHYNWVLRLEQEAGRKWSLKRAPTVWEGVYEKKGDEITEVIYTRQQVDQAYRTIQKPVESPQEDVSLFAMPGKEKELEAIGKKMAKMKAPAPKKYQPPTVGKPKKLPRAKTKKQDWVKAITKASATGETKLYALAGVNVEGKNLVASDGRRMFIAEGKWGADGLYLDTKALSQGLLGKKDKSGQSFPKWMDIVPDYEMKDAIVISDASENNNMEVVYRRIKQAASITDIESRGITVLLNKDKTLGFAAATPEVGHVEINIMPGAKVLGAANPRFLMDALEFHAIRADKDLKFYFPYPERPIMIVGHGTKTITMPVNLGEEPSVAEKRIVPQPEKPKGPIQASIGASKSPGLDRALQRAESKAGRTTYVRQRLGKWIVNTKPPRYGDYYKISTGGSEFVEGQKLFKTEQEAIKAAKHISDNSKSPVYVWQTDKGFEISGEKPKYEYAEIRPEGPGLTKAEKEILSKQQVAEAEIAQEEGQKVGYKMGAREVERKVAELQWQMKTGNFKLAQMQNDMYDLVKNGLPTYERGKIKVMSLLKAISPQRTKQANLKLLNRAAEKIKVYAEQAEQRRLRKEIISELKKTKIKKRGGLPRGKYTADIQRQINSIKKYLFMDRDLARTQIALNLERYESGQMSYEDMISDNQRLNMAGIKGMNSGELQNTLDNIKSLIETGKLARQAQKELDEQRMEAIRTDAVKVLTGGRGLKEGRTSVPRETLEARKTAAEKVTNWQYGWDNYLDKLSKYDKASKMYESDLSKFGSIVYESLNNEAAGVDEQINKIYQQFIKIYGIKTPAQANKIFNQLKQERKLGKFKNADGVEIELTLTGEQLIKKYQELKDPTLEATFRGGITEEGKVWGMRWTDEIIQAVTDALSAPEKAWADYQMKFYQEYYDSVNEIYRDIYGIDLPHNLYYSPIGRDIEADLPEVVLMAKEAGNYAAVTNGSLKTRTANALPLKFTDADSVLVNHIFQMEHFKAWANTMRDIRRVFMNKDIRTAIRQYHGSDILRQIDTQINDMARGGADKKKINRMIDNLRRNFTLAILGGKPVIGLKQTPSVIAYATEMSFKDFVAGIASFWEHPLRNTKFMRENSAYFNKRWKAGFERDISFAMKRGYSKTLAQKGNIRDWFMILIRTGDKTATASGGWAVYQKAIKEGKSKTDALKEAEIVTERTQPTGSMASLSPLQRGGSWSKLFTMFQNQPNKYFRIVADNARNVRYGRKGAFGALKNILLAWVVLPALFQYIGDAFQFKKKNQLRALVLGPINNLLVIGSMVNTMWGWLFGEDYDIQASPVFSTGQDLKNAITKTVKIAKAGRDPYKDIDMNDIITAIEYYSQAAGKLTGTPTPYAIQLEKSVKNLSATEEERQKQTKERLPGWRRSKAAELVYSPYALKSDDKIKAMSEERDKISRDIEASLPKNIQSKMEQLGLRISAPSRRLGDFYLNDKRYEFYVNETKKNMINIFRKGIPKNEKIFRQRMDLAKEKARIQLRKMIKSNKL